MLKCLVFQLSAHLRGFFPFFNYFQGHTDERSSLAFDCFTTFFFIFITCFLEKLVPRLRKGLYSSSAE